MNNEQRKEWSEYMRWITPILVTVCIFLLNTINCKVNDIDQKLFKHLTNDELHPPRSLFVTRAEFTIYQGFRSTQMEEITSGVKELKEILREHDRTTSRGK